MNGRYLFIFDFETKASAAIKINNTPEIVKGSRKPIIETRNPALTGPIRLPRI